MRRTLRGLGMATIVALLIALAALPGVSAQEENAQVRVVHAVPDGPPVDVYIDGVNVLTDVTFFTASDYQPLPAGPHLVQVTAADTAVSGAVISETLTLAAGQPYTVLAAGTPDSIAATVLEDERTVPTAGDTKIRFIHAVPGAPAVDIRRVGADVPLINNLAFREASDYLPLLPGSYALNVVATGQTEVLFAFDESFVADEPIYDIFLVGTLPNIRAETVSPAALAAPPPPTIQAGATAPAAAQATAAPTATQAAPAQPTATQATAVQPTPTQQAPAQLPTTGGYAAAPLALTAVAVLLIGVGALLWRRGRPD